MSTNPSALRHDNHFNLIRMVAASLVLVSHSYALATGNPAMEPLRTRLGVTWGSIAVDIFFATSGYLVTASLFRSSSLLTFARARALRVFPGLWVALLSTTVVVSLAFTALPLLEFWSSKETWRYLVRTGALLLPGGIAYDLPGAFMNVPWAKPGKGGPINGSLWTLPIELHMYFMVAAGFIVVRALHRRLKGSTGAVMDWMRPLLIVTAAIALALDILTTWRADHRLALHMFTMFFSGAALWCCQIDFARWWKVALVALLAVVGAAFVHRMAFFVLYAATLPFIVLALAYAPGERLKTYNRLGDYSYGVYIYAFPIQQAMLSLFPGIGPWTLTLAASIPTLACAMASWHFIEKRALALKSRPRLRLADAGTPAVS